jgi:hypothetical protein
VSFVVKIPKLRIAGNRGQTGSGKGGWGGVFSGLLFDVVLPPEPFDTACGVYQLLLARKEGVAGGTDFNLDIPGGGTGFDYVPAGAGDFSQFILGMDAVFHL